MMIDVITAINIYLRGQDQPIKRAGGETTLHGDGRERMFPDMLLYGDSSSLSILQGWEGKMPDTPMHDREFIADAERKANALGLDSFVLWNFANAHLYIKNERGCFVNRRQWACPSINNRDDVSRHKNEWEEMLFNVINDDNRFFQEGAIRPVELVERLSAATIPGLIKDNVGLVADALKRKCNKDRRAKAYLRNWLRYAEVEHGAKPGSEYSTYAKLVLVNWINRFIFANIIRWRYNGANAVCNLTGDSSISEAEEILAEITKQYDFFNVFTKIEYNDEIPSLVWRRLMFFNRFLVTAVEGEVSQEVLQQVMEMTTDASKRELSGQYATPATLAKILTEITMLDRDAELLDCCCGTGTIARAAIDNKIARDSSLEKAYATVWASDKYSYPLQMANICISRPDAINIPARLFQCDALELRPNQTVQVTNPADGSTIELKVPEFDCIVSNLPFVAAENDDSRLPDVDGRADLYVKIALSLPKVCKVGGRVGIITSNSWLASRYGLQFIQSLGKDFLIRQVHTSGKGRWFQNADVVATILVLEKKTAGGSAASAPLPKFFLWQKNIEEMGNDSALCERFIDSIVQEREVADLVRIHEYTAEQYSSLLELGFSLNALFYDVAWMAGIKEKLLPLTSIFKAFRGSRRGWDALFFPKHGEHRIERDYLIPALYNAKDVVSYETTATGQAFACAVDIPELERKGHKGAKDWIERFSVQVNGTGKPLPEALAWSKHRWYELDSGNTCQFFTMMNPEQRFFFAHLDKPTFINQRLIGLRPMPGYTEDELYLALLNSLLSLIGIESCGFGRGLGVLDVSKNSLERIWIPNPDLLTAQQKQDVVKLFGELKKRPIYPLMEEMQKPDRLAFEKCVFDAYGIASFFEQAVNTILAMQTARLSVKKSRRG